MRLSELVEIKKGKKPPVVRQVPIEGDLRLLQIEDLRHRPSVKFTELTPKSVVAIESDVILAWDGANAGISNCGLSGVVGSTLAVLRPHRPEEVWTPYLGAFLRSRESYLRANCKGAAIPHIDPKCLADLDINLPPMDEQRRIANRLEQADKLQAQRSRTLELLDTLTQSIFLDMFGHHLSEHVSVRALADVVREGADITYGIVQAGPEIPDGVPYIKTGNLVNGVIRVDQLSRTSNEIALRYKRSRLDADDIVMSIRATVGTTALVPADLAGANLTQGTARIAPGEDVLPIYLLHFLRSRDTQNWIRRQVKGATFREITLTRLRELPVVVPPMSQQVEFVKRMDAVSGLMKDVSRSADSIREQCQGLLQAAFSEKS